MQWVGDHIRPRIKVPESWSVADSRYYADYGQIDHFSPAQDQQRQIFVVTDLNVSPLLEINIGVGIGTTAATDHLIVKGILGRRFDWGRHSAID